MTIFLLCVGLMMAAPVHAQLMPLDIGGALPPGSLTPLGPDDWFVTAGGQDIWGPADQFYFAHGTLPVYNDFTAVVGVKSMEPYATGHEWGKAGLMAREDTSPGSPNTMVCRSLKQGVTFQWRDFPDDWSWNYPVGINSYGQTDIVWLRLDRQGDMFTGSYAVGGAGPPTSWDDYSVHSTPLVPGIEVGLATTSHGQGVGIDVEYIDFKVGPYAGPPTYATPSLPATAGGGDGYMDVHEVIDNGWIPTQSRCYASLASGTGTIVDYTASVLNIQDNGPSGNFAGDNVFGVVTAGHRVVGEVDALSMIARGTIRVPSGLGGNWTFGVNTDDGCTLMFPGQNFISVVGGELPRFTDGTAIRFTGGRAAADTLGVINLPAGDHPFWLTYHEDGGEAAVEFFAARGVHTAFNPNDFHLVGAVDGLQLVGIRQPVQLWKPYWFLDAKLLLHYNPGFSYAYTGFWGGWYPYHYYSPYLHYSYYYYPWYGPVSCHPCCWSLNWHYWWWDWPWKNNCQYSGYWNQGCWWWWHPWRGNPYFWGFLDRLSYRYWYPYPRTTFWWSWYWYYNGKGRCLEVVTLGDAEEGGRVLPLDDAVLDNLEVESHEFDVNGGRYTGEFTSSAGPGLERITVEDLPGYYLGLGASDEDLAAFERSDVYQNLLAHSAPGDEVFVQWAEFSIPEPRILIDQPQGGSMLITEGGQNSYEITLATPPKFDVAIEIKPEAGTAPIDLGNGLGNPVTVNFPSGDAGPRTVTVTAPEDTEQERNELAVVTHTVLSEDPEYFDAELPAVTIGIEDNDLGAWGFLEGDINRDGYVNISDAAIMAYSWALCTDPGEPGCLIAGGSPDTSDYPLPSGWSDCEPNVNLCNKPRYRMVGSQEHYVMCDQTAGCTIDGCECNLFEYDPDTGESTRLAGSGKLMRQDYSMRYFCRCTSE